MSKTAVMMAGGTGGHIFPALAVADALKQQGWRVVWLGTANGMESTLVPSRGYPLIAIDIAGLRGKGWLRKITTPFRLCKAILQCRAALKQEKPQIVAGFGGYVAFPGGVAAKLAGIPLVVHEQNSVAGLTNRCLAQLAQRVLTAFPAAFPLGGKVQLIGNPVRADIAAVSPPEVRYASRQGALRVLVVGGSLGAQALNSIVPQALALLTEAARPLVLHQAGQKHLADLEKNYQQAGVAGKNCQTVSFIEDMASEYAQADVVICRSGALTVAEVAAIGVPALFVPFPFAVDDHQTGNAAYLVEAGAAWLCQQKDLNAEWLANWLSNLQRSELLNMAQAARALGLPQAGNAVADICIAVANKN